MCAGVDGPGEPSEGAGTYSKTCRRCNQLLWNCNCLSPSAAAKQTKQRKVPYKNHSGTVLASYEGVRAFVEMYRTDKDKRYDDSYMVSWHIGLSSGAASYTKKSNAIREYNSKVPSKYRI